MPLMDSWAAKKRPWGDDTVESSGTRRRDSTIAAGERPPLPQHAGFYSRDSQNLNQRRLPPLCTPTCSTPLEPLASSSLLLSSPVQEAGKVDKSRPRSLSLFDIFHPPPKRQRHEVDTEHSVAFTGALDSDRSLPPISTDAHHPRVGTDPAPHTAGPVICCSPDCEGQACSDARTLMRKVACELVLSNAKVRSILRKDYHSSRELPEDPTAGITESLRWALDLVQWTNLNLQEHLDNSILRSPSQSALQADTSSTMRRGQHPLDREDQSPPSRHHSGPLHGYSNYAHPLAMTDDPRRNPYSNDMAPMVGSPHHTASSSGSVFHPSQSPMQAPQSARSTMLPSPSSMNFSNNPNLPPISPPSTSLQPSAQSAHLQDLQHQVSIKTLAFQTLQREYDSLLQKLERQRTKCATLEKKFEVSDVEINALTEEKEKLQSQITSLEAQVEELQQSRDEARRQLVANGAQYMRIMEMANRLQAQGADDKKRWEAERAELEQRIRVLEEAMVTGPTIENTDTQMDTGSSPPPPIIQAHSPSIGLSGSSTETINVLRTEIGRLRSLTLCLETALQTMKEESISIQAAARQLVHSGGKIEQTALGATGG
ncbi:hypothetical protein P154DRAFT_192545 [Amniculicola lignicola CBS 123094]|uniref:Uncharacterized protein n=1 Tax=Amniculicola lignicola CBS 123094 TaxID=1392246 RepID=A0A6A5WGB7_9PLEO|nr:hypothetical protein P154DRAFT_192545 [Amniculicola lignicola CBS 123094]